MSKRLYAYGYVYGLLGGLVSTFVFVIIHISITVLGNGLKYYLQTWDYPKPFIVTGIIISVLPSGLMGAFFAFLLLKDLTKGNLNYRHSILRGCCLGIIGILLVFGFILISPLASIVIRMGDVGLLYLLMATILAAGVGSSTGALLTKLIFASTKGNEN
jgi:hypothetical protein